MATAGAGVASDRIISPEHGTAKVAIQRSRGLPMVRREGLLIWYGVVHAFDAPSDVLSRPGTAAYRSLHDHHIGMGGATDARV